MRSVDVLVAGAGLAGLSAAWHLTRAGLEVALLEAGDDVGGRVRTDEVDGLLLDRGFQLYNPAYPEPRRLLDHRALDLRGYDAGVVVAVGEGRHRVGDPRRLPHWVLSSSLAPVGSPRAKARLALVAARLAVADPRRIAAAPDEAIGATLAKRGVSGPLTDRVLRPFLAGVFGEDELATSRRFADLVLRSFVRGTPSIPAAGIRQIPRQLAAALPAGVLVVGCPVLRVGPGGADTAHGRVRARAVVVATDPPAAAALVPRLRVPPMNALTTFYHLAPEPPTSARTLHLDGDRCGPVVNTSVISNVAPSYAPLRTLVSSTVLGAHDDGPTERAVRGHLARIYGTDTSRWEHVRTYALPAALPAMLPPLDVRQPVRLGAGLYVAGDHRDTASIQGAMVSGRRAAQAVVRDLGGTARS